MAQPSDLRNDGQHTILVVDDADLLGGPVSDFLTAWGHSPVRLTQPDDAELRRRLAADLDAVAVVSRDDIVALRYALLAEHLRPGIRLVVTIFDRTVADEVARAVPNCAVLVMTDAIVPSLLASCLHPGLASVLRIGGQPFAVHHDGRVERLERIPKTRSDAHPKHRNRAVARFRSLNTSARALLMSVGVLLTAFSAEAALGAVVLHEDRAEAVWQATRVLATVGSSSEAEHGPGWYKYVSALLMLLVLATAGLFTASLVERVNDQRATSMFGRRAIPSRDHVIVVGLGQVGLRLCTELRRLGIKVVAVERDSEAPCLPLARALGIKVVAVERDSEAPCLPLARALGLPVVIGRGGDRFMLRRLGVHDARALAAVSSNGLENIAVAVAVRATAPHQRIVLRSGGGDDVTTESQSLFRIGTATDVSRIIGALAACYCLDVAPLSVFPVGQTVHALLVDLSVADLTQEPPGLVRGGPADTVDRHQMYP